MKMNLITMVQSVLNSMGGDKVNSIDDTPRSTEIAIEAKNVFYDLVHSQEWAHLHLETQLTGLGDTSKPSHMLIPESVAEIYKLKYDVSLTGATNTTYRDIIYKLPNEFLDHVYNRDSSASNIKTVTTDNSVKLFILNDTAPTYWTSFDDEYIVFDSFDSAVDTTLQTSKSVITAYKEPTWTHSDTFIPDLPSSKFPLFLSELTNACHIYYLQQGSQVDSRRSLRQRAMQNNDSRSNTKRKHNFGRK
jgi:hypothetical protein